MHTDAMRGVEESNLMKFRKRTGVSEQTKEKNKTNKRKQTKHASSAEKTQPVSDGSQRLRDDRVAKWDK